MKQLLFIFSLTPFLFLFSCDDDSNGPNDCLTGSGSTITETRTVDDFAGIDAEIVGNIYLTQGSPQSLTITTHPNVMDELETEVQGDVLHIGTERCMSDIETLDIFITIPDIESVTFAGVGNIESENDWVLDNLGIVFSGVGNAYLNGSCDNFSYTLAGVGDLEAFDFITANSSINISGNGNVKITTTNQLNIVIAGNGNVSYRGDPDITSSISGNGNIIDAN